MFRRLEDARADISFSFEGREVTARPGDSVAAALLAAGLRSFRATPVSGAPRAPWCMMGACFDCLVEIDGVASRQACMTQVAPGMRVRRQRGAKALESDPAAETAA
ncbi:(2Fe-2S)-binding protein [Limobrevibacterium gyesilva]|uniref:(2Fe-2S)-binding protein n=1 Tax=Limobrevibacterium gyesilva TaxID=2991712 RepID=A0AA41YK63_9PROT|nr:(2Fe-2S)-binding protein [Limobrevibacterium gyesilva]MCW3474090.1 (2Fe-2S)-binding protein [Limobrevibacterium gyesilva]